MIDLINLVEQGIRVNPEPCIVRLEDAALAKKAELLAILPVSR